MLMLAPPTAVGTNVVLGGGAANSFGSKLAGALSHGSSTADLRQCSPVVEWEGLKHVCSGAENVYLLSAIDLPLLPTDAELEAFTSGVSRVVDCCLECGVESLVFTSSSSVVSSRIPEQGPERNDGARVDTIEKRLTYVTRQEDARAHAIARAEASVLEAGLFHRTLSWLGWGLNRVAVGPKNNSGSLTSGMVHVDNLVEAHLLAAAHLKTVAQDSVVRHSEVERKDAEVSDAGAFSANGAEEERASSSSSSSNAAPACSGQAYFVADGQSCNPRVFLDGILNGLGFATSKVVRVPIRVALFAAWVAELVCKAGITATPIVTKSDVRVLTENRSFTNARAKRDLEYVPRVDPATASKQLVESLERAGWAKHQVSRPALAFWVCNPGGIWLTTLAAFGGPCPPFMAPLARTAEQVGVSLFHQASTVRAVCVAVYVIHVLEAVYAFRVARQAGHRDTALGWMAQTFLLGFPSIFLVNELVPVNEEEPEKGKTSVV